MQFFFNISENWNIFVSVAPHRRYPYFDVVVGLAWSNDPESCAGGSEAIHLALRARQIKGDDPDEKGYPGPPGWVLCEGLLISPRKLMFVEKLQKLETGRNKQRRWDMNKTNKW